MDNRTIFTKTAKGLGESIGKTRALSRQFRKVINEVNGIAAFQDLMTKLDDFSEDKLIEILTKLKEEDYIREFNPPPVIDTRLKIDAAVHSEVAGKKKNADAQAQQKLDARFSKELEEKLQRELEEIAAEFARQAIADQARKVQEEKEREEKAAKENARLEAEKNAALLKRQKIEEKQKKEAEEKARRELELKNKKEAAERARLEAQAKQAKKAAEETAQREAKKAEAAELARLKVEQEKQDEAEEQARRDKAEKLRLAAEAQLRQEEGEAQRQAELQAQLQAEHQAELQANEKISEAANALELAAHKAQEQARLREIAKEREKSRQEAVALTQERREARHRAKLEQNRLREAERRARRNERDVKPSGNTNFYDTSRGWGMSLIGICFALGLVLFAWTQLSSFDEKIVQFEKTASQQFQQPVKIGKLAFSLAPLPQWQLENVVIGAQGQIKVQRINAPVGWTSLFAESTVFSSLELLSPVLNEEGLGWLLFGSFRQQGLALDQLSASNFKVDSDHLDLGVFDLDAKFAEKFGEKFGENKAWSVIKLVSPNKEMTIELQAKGELVQVQFNAKSFALPFGSSLNLNSFSAEGNISANALTLSKFYGLAYDGILTGSAKLSWDRGWMLSGDIKAKQIEVGKWLPELFEDGQVDGEGEFLMQAREANKLFPSQRMNGNFSVQNGTIRGVDMVKFLQGVDNFGSSSFKNLSGGFSYESGTSRLRNVSLAAVLVSANGYVDVAANQDMNGRFGVNLSTPVRNVRVDLLVSGALKKPHFSSSSTIIRVPE